MKEQNINIRCLVHHQTNYLKCGHCFEELEKKLNQAVYERDKAKHDRDQSEKRENELKDRLINQVNLYDQISRAEKVIKGECGRYPQGLDCSCDCCLYFKEKGN